MTKPKVASKGRGEQESILIPKGKPSIKDSRPAFHIDKDLKEAAQKAAKAFDEEEFFNPRHDSTQRFSHNN